MTRGSIQSAGGSRWLIPVTCVVIGGAMLLAGWLGGQLDVGLLGLVVMTLFGVFVAVSGRSETIRGLRGDGRDERFARIDLLAAAITGHVLILAVVIAFLVEIARGHSASPYEWLGALAGGTYILVVALLVWRG